MASALLTPTLQGFSITSAAFLSGGAFSINAVTLPPLLLAPTPLLLKQWRAVYAIGSTIAPRLALLSALSSFYLSYALSEPRYAAAGALTMSIAPWTVLVMLKTNNMLFAKEKKFRGEQEGAAVSAEEDREVRALIGWWGRAHAVRGLLPLLGTVVGGWAVVS